MWVKKYRPPRIKTANTARFDNFFWIELCRGRRQTCLKGERRINFRLKLPPADCFWLLVFGDFFFIIDLWYLKEKLLSRVNYSLLAKIRSLSQISLSREHPFSLIYCNNSDFVFTLKYWIFLTYHPSLCFNAIIFFIYYLYRKNLSLSRENKKSGRNLLNSARPINLK